MDDGTARAVRKWKSHRFRPAEIPFVDAVKSLGGDEQLVEARQSPTRKTDWVICRAGTSSPAVFVYAGVFAEADVDYETGNLLWGDAPVPAGMDESRLYAGYKAAYSYAIETYHDKEFWELQAVLDSYMETVKGFNPRELPRRTWQNGSTWHGRYYLRSPMFLTCEARGGHPDPPPGLHEWVVAAHQKSKTYRANPVRPLVCAVQDGRLEKIANCTPNRLEYGDVVSVVFGLTYVEDREDWGPVPTITHVIRVQRANRDVYQLVSQLASVGIEDEVGAMPIGAVVDEEASVARTKPRPRLDLPTSMEEDNATVNVDSRAVVASRDRALPHSSGDESLSDEPIGGSSSEMDVDDDGSGTSQDLTGSDTATVNTDSSGGSAASTFVDIAASDDSAESSQRAQKKRKTRSSAHSDEDVGGSVVVTRTPRGRRGGNK